MRVLDVVGFAVLLLALMSGAAGCEPNQGQTDAGHDPWVGVGLQDWTLGPGGEDFPWRDFTLDHDLWVRAVRAKAPPGTHHVILWGPGVYNDLFVSVPGTGEFHFPPGVGFALRAADHLATQIHVLNATGASLSGESGIEVLPAEAPGEITAEANILNAAVLSFSLPAHQRTVIEGQCTLDHDYTLVAIAPHMHRAGVHHRATLDRGGTSIVLFDGDFQFTEQIFHPLDGLAGKQGDVIHFACTYDNTTDADIPWGNLAAAEMCTAQIYRYPAGSSDFCTS